MSKNNMSGGATFQGEWEHRTKNGQMQVKHHKMTNNIWNTLPKKANGTNGFDRRPSIAHSTHSTQSNHSKKSHASANHQKKPNVVGGKPTEFNRSGFQTLLDCTIVNMLTEIHSNQPTGTLAWEIPHGGGVGPTAFVVGRSVSNLLKHYMVGTKGPTFVPQYIEIAQEDANGDSVRPQYDPNHAVLTCETMFKKHLEITVKRTVTEENATLNNTVYATVRYSKFEISVSFVRHTSQPE